MSVIVAGAVVAVGVVVAVALRSGSDEGAPPAVNSVAGNFRACLVRSSAGSPVSTAVWEALRKAAGGRVNAQTFVAPPGPPGVPYLNGVVGVGCDVVVVAEPGFVPVVEKVAAKAQRQRFLVVGGGSAAGNVEVVADAAAVSGWIGGHAGG
ncbi:hypothetical protein [Actinoplanes subtropicus]|uniref:hypothetical protein n=1 Tax=Actinoplanes subtropicus TaxID=543632 RepID=UPI0012F7E5D5|nr:hypothetical protein [Actinoplanes subtropicus]